jgi:hypothetical protein
MDPDPAARFSCGGNGGDGIPVVLFKDPHEAADSACDPGIGRPGVRWPSRAQEGTRRFRPRAQSAVPL